MHQIRFFSKNIVLIIIFSICTFSNLITRFSLFFAFKPIICRFTKSSVFNYAQLIFVHISLLVYLQNLHSVVLMLLMNFFQCFFVFNLYVYNDFLRRIIFSIHDFSMYFKLSLLLSQISVMYLL